MISALAFAGLYLASPQTYDFKGVALGTTLDEFRTMEHPDGKAAKVVCSGEKVPVTRNFSSEPVGVMVFDETEKSLGVTRCIWINTEGQYGIGSAAELSLADSGYASYSYGFSFIKDPVDGIAKLYSYSGTTNVAAYAAIVVALAKKWGSPKLEKGSVQNRIGNTFEKETATWQGPQGSITVESRWSKVDDLRIEMTDSRLAKIVADAREKKKAETKNPI